MYFETLSKNDPKKALELIEKQLAEQSLAEFIKQYWRVVEPENPLVWGWTMDCLCLHLEAVTNGDIRKIIFNVPPGFSKSLIVNVFWPAWEWGPRAKASKRYLCFSYSQRLTIRDNARFLKIITDEQYKKNWSPNFLVTQESVILVSNNKTGWKLASSVGGVATGERGDRIIIDDGNNVQESESDAIKLTTNTWVRETMPDRLNDLRTGVIVNIQQRTAEDDVTGTLLTYGQGYEHVMIPMEFDSGRKCYTSIGWEDPRTYDGELAFPERFPQNIVGDLRAEKGPYAWCTPQESPILMSDLSMKPIGEIKEGDLIIGFTKGDTTRKPHIRRRLIHSKVIAIHKSVQKVVKMTLESGNVIRCTEDHKWYTGRNDVSHQLYKAAKVGSALMRVCDSTIPDLNAEDSRKAGWLAGFFDGEGSVTMNLRRSGESPACLVSFTQGADRNLPLCHKLEETLSHFGFDYGYQEYIRDDRKSKENAPLTRAYHIRWGNGKRAPALPAIQKFLHVIKPAKWRDRLINGALTTRFISSEDRVVSIEPDGEETVYGLQTETGNYVVWGLASSNSGQYQQTPEPRGGGIIKRDWWQVWDTETAEACGIDVSDGKLRYPLMDYIIHFCDTAYTEKEENDPSAGIVFGIFRVKGIPKIMMMDAWNDRLEFNSLLNKIVSVSKKRSIDCLLIEAKASGKSIAQEIRRMGMEQDFVVGEVTPLGDKTARMHSVVPLLAAGCVYAPDKEWAEMVINQCSVFPKAKHDDLADCVSGGLSYLRRTGAALLPTEGERIVNEQLMYYGADANEPLYDV